MKRIQTRLQNNEWVEIRDITPLDAGRIGELLRNQWGDQKVVSRGRVHDAGNLPGFMACVGPEIVGLVTLHCESRDCEVVTLDAYIKGQGIGSLLLQAAERFAFLQGCDRVWLITTNDNVGALTFYQKVGFRIVAVYPDAVTEARKLKPQIPHIAENGIEIRDEIELAKTVLKH